jgi:hypothetical protein
MSAKTPDNITVDNEPVALPEEFKQRIEEEATRGAFAAEFKNPILVAANLYELYSLSKACVTIGSMVKNGEMDKEKLHDAGLEILGATILTPALFLWARNDLKAELTEMYEEQYRKADRDITKADDLPDHLKQKINGQSTLLTGAIASAAALGTFMAKDAFKDHPDLGFLRDASQQMEGTVPGAKHLPLIIGATTAVVSFVSLRSHFQKEAMEQMNELRSDMSFVKKIEEQRKNAVSQISNVFSFK